MICLQKEKEHMACNLSFIVKSEGVLKVAGGHFLARDVIYTSCSFATMSVSVCLSVCL